MAEETATNPVEGEDTSADTLPETQEVEADGEEQELDADGNPIAREPEDEEIDLDDLKLKVPKDQAQKVREALLRQADYTRKTQAHAEDVRAFEAERQAFQGAAQAEIQAQAEAVSISQRMQNIAAYVQQNGGWQALSQNDPFGAQELNFEYQELERGHAQAFNKYTGLRQQRELTAQQETAKRLEAGRATLAREIKGWGPELGESLLQTGVREYGFERAEIEDSFDDPRLIKVLHDAHQWRQSQTKTKQAQTRQAEQAAKPAAKVGSASAPPTGLDDRLSAAEWMRRREAQTRKRA